MEMLLKILARSASVGPHKADRTGSARLPLNNALISPHPAMAYLYKYPCPKGQNGRLDL